MDRPYIFIATPMDKNKTLHAETAAYCSAASSLPNVEWGYNGTVSCEMSRNTLIEDHNHFGKKFTNIFFIDSDVVPHPKCLEHFNHVNVDIIVGLYPLYLEDGVFWSVTGDDGKWLPVDKPLPREPFEVELSGAGCLYVKREVLDKIGWPWFKMSYQKKWENNGMPVKEGEDEYFCRRAKEEGYKIIADPLMAGKHYNNVDILKMYYRAKMQIEKKYRVELSTF